MQRFVIGLLAFLCLFVSAGAQELKDVPREIHMTPPDQPQAIMPLHMAVDPVGQCWTYKGGNTAFYGEIPAGKYVFVRLRTSVWLKHVGASAFEESFFPMDQDISFALPSGQKTSPYDVVGGRAGTKAVPDGTPAYAGDLLAAESDWGWYIYLVRQAVSYKLAYDQFPENHEYGVAEVCMRDVPSLHGTVVPNTAWSSMGWVIQGHNLL